MKKFISILLSAFLAVGTIGSLPAEATVCPLVGSGTQQSPWLIATAADLANVGVGAGCATTLAASQHYRLTANISLSGSFTPMTLRASGGSFLADFDGAGHTVSGLYISTDSTDPQGLFGEAANATIHDIKITGTSIDALDDVGAVVGRATNVTLSKVTVSISGAVTGREHVGGLVGIATGGAVRDSYFASTSSAFGVVGGGQTGGAIGFAEDVAAERVAVRANLHVYAGGGIIGGFRASSIPTLSELFYTGNLVSDTYVGGLIGALSSTGPLEANLTSSVVRGLVRTTEPGGNYLPQGFIGQTSPNNLTVHYSHGYSTARYQRQTSIDVTDATPQFGSPYTASWIYSERNSNTGLEQLGARLSARVSIVNASTDANDPWQALSKPVGVKVSSGTHWVFDVNPTSPWNDGRVMPAGIYNLGFFGAVVDQCDVGYFSATGGVPCEPARMGHYVPQIGQMADTPCPTGTYQPFSGGQECIRVPLGAFVADAGQSDYRRCQAGEYQDVLGSSSCKLARAGRYTNETGMSQDLRCALGTFQPSTGMISCDPAPRGKYVDSLGATSPTDCPVGKFQPVEGESTCLLAPAGSFVEDPGQREYVLCHAGTYQAAAGSRSCDPARAGRSAPIPGMTEDSLCSLGTYQPDTGMITCIQAPAGSFVANTGAVAPSPCPTGSTSNLGAFSCYPIGGGGGGGGGGPAPVVTVPVVSPSLNVQLVKVAPGQTVNFKGENLDKIKSILIAGKECIFSVKGGELTLTIPAALDAGNKDLILKSETASVTVKDAIVVAATPVPVVKPVIAPVVTFKKVGSKVTVYVTSKTPVSLTLGKKVVAKSLVGTRVRYIVTLPKGKSVLSAKAAGKVIKRATYVIAK